MIIITLLYSIIFYQIVRGFWEQGALWYKDPKFWLHLVSIGILASVYTFN